MNKKGKKNMQVADPNVSKAKYDSEVSSFLKGYPHYKKKGILLLDQTFPQVKLAFFSLKIIPHPLIFSVKIDFTNYDLEPPSIKFINAFNDELIPLGQLPHQFPRKVGQSGNQINLQPLALAQADGIPFFCIPGVREYHNHPAHTGDSWLLHRNIGGEGTLGFLVDKLYQYGISSINGMQIPLAIQRMVPSFDAQSISE